MGLAKAFDTVVASQRGHLFPWGPVCLAIGIAGYFLLPSEPDQALVVGLGLAAAAALVASRKSGEAAAPLWLAFMLICCGVLLAVERAERVAAPVLTFRYYGPIEGRIVDIDRNLSDRVRLTLDQVVLTDTPPARTPHKVRVSLQGPQGFTPLRPGARVILTGHLSPPPGPSEPGGFDFRRMAWFERLGAVGYSRTPVLSLEAATQDTFGLWLTDLRLRSAQAIRDRVPGQTGAFAAAVLTGERSGLSRATLDQMRGSNLAHLLAISGLHMGLLTGFVFLVLRYAIALVPVLALRVDGRKVAAGVALIAAAGYLALSGGSVATQRAFVMAAVMLGAVMLDRQMLTLRAVALAATVILIWRPESLLSVGFQMSFAATTALVWVFSVLRDQAWWKRARRWRGVLALIVSSGVAGLATAPIGAANFNQIAQYGLLANLMSVPVMGFVVMPAGVVAICLAPLGLSGPALWVMGLGCRWILAVAERITALEGAVVPIMTPGSTVIPVLAAGALWVVLWQGRARWAGAAGIALALGLWSQATRPPILIADTGTMVGVMVDGARIVNKPRGDGFTARTWLENDGLHATQADAARPDPAGFEATVAGLRLRQMTNAQAKRAQDPCAGTDLLILPNGQASGCPVISEQTLRRTGALAIWPTSEGLFVITASERSGYRLWSPRTVVRGADLHLGVVGPGADPYLARATDQ